MTNLKQVTKLYTRQMDENRSLYECYARTKGLTGKSMLILMWIYYNPQGISQNTICQKTYSTKQVVNATIKAFQAKGYLQISGDDKDKRAKRLHLTPAGQAFASPILDDLERAEMQAMSLLTPDQQAQFLDLLTIFNDGFRGEMTELLKKKERKDQ